MGDRRGVAIFNLGPSTVNMFQSIKIRKVVKITGTIERTVTMTSVINGFIPPGSLSINTWST